MITVHGLSYAVYTGKVEGYLRAKGIDYRLEEVSIQGMKQVHSMTGLHKVPAIDLGDGNWLSDSHLIIEYLEKTQPAPAIYLSDPLAQFLALVLEEYFDEWVWLQCIYLRFCDKDGFDYMVSAMARVLMRDLSIPHFAKRFLWARNRRRYLKAIGAGGEHAPLIEERFLGLLQQLESIFAEQSYLQGDRPTVADFALFGPAFRHFVGDPYSGEIVREKAPATLEWSARIWNLKPEKFAEAPEPTGLNPLVKPFLTDFNDNVVPYLQANQAAYERGQKKTRYTDQGVEWECKTVPHRVWSAAKLQKSYEALPDSSKAALRETGYLDSLLSFLERPIDPGSYSVPSMPIPARSAA